MSRKPTSSKFGHLFGDTSESSSSSKESRLSSSSDLYKDPLAALIPPVTATTTTRASTARGTLSPPSISATTATTTSSKGSPPGSSSNSRSSSRLQHHALFSSLTQQDSSGSLFDSSSTTKRDLLFGEGTSISSSSTSRRTSTPPLSKISSNTSTSHQSSRVPTPPLGTSTQVRGTSLDADASPLGISIGVMATKEDDSRSVTSPLTSEPLARTSSVASNTSSKSSSIRSIKSVLSQEEQPPVSTRPTSTGPLKAPTPSIASTSVSTNTRAPVKKTSVSSTVSEKTTSPTASIPDPIFNPLTSTLPPTSSSGDWPPSTTSSQSIDTFQSISRSSSPAVSSTRSKTVFPQDLESPSPPVSSSVSRSTSPSLSVSTTSTITSAVINMPLDDAAAAFAGDMLYNPPPAHQHMLPGRSSSFLDSGFTSRNQKTENETVNITTTTGSSAIKLGGSTGSSAGAIPGVLPRSGLSGGFSLGEDIADASNPWMNSLVDSLEQTKTREVSRVDYTQSITSGGGGNDSFLPEVAFTLGTKGEATRAAPLLLPMEDEGGFDDIFSSYKSKVSGLTSTSSSKSSKRTTTPSMLSGSMGNGDMSISSAITTTTTWNILDAVEAASMDPDFLGATGPQAKEKEKVLAMMQMPKDPLEKDISAQEVFDNPWE
ncbi:hypothetical protein MVEG_07183 [Podila verticillata NRRL 6337]|nr:hypothetical protein MVEG_07183 [Podila verticillata NRRL 6337]